MADTLLVTAVAGNLFSPVVPATDKECDKDSYRLGEVTSPEYYSIFISLGNLMGFFCQSIIQKADGL